MSAPVNVKLDTPTILLANWSEEAAKWRLINSEIGGNEEFYPLTIKAAYVIGIIHDLCEVVSHLLSHVRAKETTYIPAYGIFASGVDLLGRCLNGNDQPRGSSRDLKTGFCWLANKESLEIDDASPFITTSTDSHSIAKLVALRNFAAHGQAQSRISSIDFEILAYMPPLLGEGLERYWQHLKSEDDLCNNLAKANVLALRNWPILKSWSLFERDSRTGRYHSIQEIFTRFDWQLK